MRLSSFAGYRGSSVKGGSAPARIVPRRREVLAELQGADGGTPVERPG